MDLQPKYIFFSGHIYKIEPEICEPKTLFNERIKWIVSKLKQSKDVEEIIKKSRIWSNSKFLGVKY